MQNIFNEELKIINIGLKSFLEPFEQKNIKSIHVDFSPPLDVENKYFEIASINSQKIKKANQEAVERILKSKPVLVGMDKAINVIPGMKKNLILHAGPPITWERMCGPMRGAIIGALIYEGIAKNPGDVEKIAASEKIEYAPCHEHSAVGPMAGVVSASMPVFVLQNEEYGNKAYCTMNEGLGKVLRYGAFSNDVIKKLKWMEAVLYPALKKAIETIGKIDLKNIMAQALHMGDEVHNRNRAATSLLYRTLAPAIVETSGNSETAASVLEFINNNDHFFLNLSMPASKVSLDAARGIKNSSVAVVMS